MSSKSSRRRNEIADEIGDGLRAIYDEVLRERAPDRFPNCWTSWIRVGNWRRIKSAQQFPPPRSTAPSVEAFQELCLGGS